MNLAQLQRAFQQHVIADDPAVLSEIVGAEIVPVATRMAVYSNAYRSRLVTALAHNYPHLQQWLGTGSFDALAWRYLQAYPSMHASVRWFGDRLASYLQASHADQPTLTELALWEWAIAAAFDSPDQEPLTEQTLSTIDATQWGALQLPLHPSFQLLRMATNAPLIYRALTNELDVPIAMSLPEPQHWIIWRQNFSPRYRSVADDEAAALTTLVGSGTFAQLCEVLCAFHDSSQVPARAVVLLKGWVRDQMIVQTAELD